MKKLIYLFLTILLVLMSIESIKNHAFANNTTPGGGILQRTMGVLQGTDFDSLNGAINYVADSSATLAITQPLVVNGNTVSVPSNLTLSFKQGGSLVYSITTDGNTTTTIHGAIDAGDYQIFGGGKLNVVIDLASNSITKTAWGTFTTTGTQASGSTGLLPNGSTAGTFTNLTDSGLTSGRIPFAGTAGLLGDSAFLTFDTTSGLSTSTKNIIGAGITGTSLTSTGALTLNGQFQQIVGGQTGYIDNNSVISSYFGIWGNNAPSALNYALKTDGTNTYVNAVSGGSLVLRNNNSTICTITTNFSCGQQIVSTVSTGSQPIIIASTTPVSNLNAYAVTYSHNGTQQTNVHIVQDTCTLGTSCSITLTGSAVFTSSTSYTCIAEDETGIFTTRCTQTSGSALAITGNSTDVIRYTLIGN